MMLLDKHNEMMDILTEKFGRASLIVDDCTVEIRCMKVITTENEFVSFVEHIDKIKRDLEQLGLLSDISNTTIIADLESNLPNGVRQDWIKIVSTKEASNKTPNEISNLMRSFFEETRLQAEYHSTDVRNNAVYERAAIKLGFVCGIQAVSLASIIAEKCEPARKEERLCLACADGTTDLKVAICIPLVTVQSAEVSL